MMAHGKILDTFIVVRKVVGLVLIMYIWGLAVIEKAQRGMLCFEQWDMHHRGTPDYQIICMHVTWV